MTDQLVYFLHPFPSLHSTPDAANYVFDSLIKFKRRGTRTSKMAKLLNNLKYFSSQFLVTFLSLALLTFTVPFLGNTLEFIGTSALLIIGSWTIAKWIKKSYFHEVISSINKAVLITGCDSGFGQLLAERLNRCGFMVYAACLNPNGPGPQELVEKAAFPNEIKLITMDVTSDTDVTRAVQEVRLHLQAKGKELWAVVNNAGVSRYACVEWGHLDEYQKVFDVNVIGLVRVTRAFLPLLRQSKGRVVNVGSVASRASSLGVSIYAMSKHALVAFSTALRREMIPWGVKVLTIEPAFYNTPMGDKNLLADGTRRMWSETPELIKDSYGEEYFQACLQCLMDSPSARNPEEVVDALQEAIISKEPEVRYKVCGLGYHIFFFLNDYLPFSLVDFLLPFRGPKIKPRMVA